MSEKLRRAVEPVVDFDLDAGRALIEAAKTAFSRAAKAAVAENDRLGIVTHGGKDGKLTERRPKPVLKSAGG
jgi:hypothetical protein